MSLTVQPSHETLVELLDLQKVDSSIDRLEHLRRNLPEQEELDSSEERLSALQAALGDQQALVEDCAMRQRKLDGEIDGVTRKVALEEERLFAGKVASPKELAALQAEIEFLKRRRSTLEDADLEVMEEREAVEKRLSVLQQEQQTLTETIAETTARRDKAAAEIESEMQDARSQREARKQKFEPELFGLYEEVRSSKSGVAIAALTGGACQGCHMKLPAQEVSQMRKTEGVIRCVECGRMLVFV